MIAEALKTLKGWVEKGYGVDIVRVSSEPNHVYFLRDRATGALLRHESPPLARQINVSSVNAFIDAVRKLCRPDKSIILYDTFLAKAFFDAETRREAVILRLYESEVYQTLCGIQIDKGNRSFNQAEFVRFLSANLAVDPTVISFFRNLKFKKDESGTSEVVQGRESVSKAVKRELFGADDNPVPASCEVNFAVYKGYDRNEEIVFSISTDIERQRFSLFLRPDSLSWLAEQTCGAIFDEVITSLPDFTVLRACDISQTLSGSTRGDEEEESEPGYTGLVGPQPSNVEFMRKLKKALDRT